nr:hypothetical protein [Abalone asfa-like virus]
MEQLTEKLKDTPYSKVLRYITKDLLNYQVRAILAYVLHGIYWQIITPQTICDLPPHFFTTFLPWEIASLFIIPYRRKLTFAQKLEFWLQAPSLINFYAMFPWISPINYIIDIKNIWHDKISIKKIHYFQSLRNKTGTAVDGGNCKITRSKNMVRSIDEFVHQIPDAKVKKKLFDLFEDEFIDLHEFEYNVAKVLMALEKYRIKYWTKNTVMNEYIKWCGGDDDDHHTAIYYDFWTWNTRSFFHEWVDEQIDRLYILYLWVRSKLKHPVIIDSWEMDYKLYDKLDDLDGRTFYQDRRRPSIIPVLYTNFLAKPVLKKYEVSYDYTKPDYPPGLDESKYEFAEVINYEYQLFNDHNQLFANPRNMKVERIDFDGFIFYPVIKLI